MLTSLRIRMDQPMSQALEKQDSTVPGPLLWTLVRTVWSLVAALCFGTAQAQIGYSSAPMMGPPLVTCTNLELMKQVPCPDSALFFHAGKGPVQQAYNAGNFKTLDDLYDQWCTGKDRFPDGRWKLSQYGDAFADNFSAWSAWSKDLKTIQAWQQARPESKAAPYAEAVYWRAYAWKARGSGYANTVSKEGWELFRERMAKAKDILTTLHERGAQCAAPYPLTLSVLTEMGASETELAAVFERGVREYPEYHNIYFAMARHYEPKWGGSLEQYERFARETAERTKSFEGMGMYARLYWLVDTRHGIPFGSDDAQPPYWSKLHAGYEDLMRLYPSSMHNLGKYADVACRSSDGELYRTLRSKIAGYEDSAKMLDPIDVCYRRHKWTP